MENNIELQRINIDIKEFEKNDLDKVKDFTFDDEIQYGEFEISNGDKYKYQLTQTLFVSKVD